MGNVRVQFINTVVMSMVLQSPVTQTELAVMVFIYGIALMLMEIMLAALLVFPKTLVVPLVFLLVEFRPVVL